MKYFLILLGSLSVLIACNNSGSSEPSVPYHHVEEGERFLTPEFIDSLTKNRQQRMVDLRRELGFECVDLMDRDYINMKIKVYPDGNYDEVTVLEKEGVDTQAIEECIKKYLSDYKINLGILRDLPDAKKKMNKHPHVYTLLIY